LLQASRELGFPCAGPVQLFNADFRGRKNN
jgi:hypothetical protein